MHTKSAFNNIIYINESLYINSCGKRTVQNSPISIERPFGRSDYCFIYIKEGQAHFLVDYKTKTLTAGNFFLFRPNTPQIYNYKPEDKTVVYWLHFAGTETEKILFDHNIEGSIFNTGVQPKFETIFEDIIDELLNKSDNYQYVLQNHLKNILALISRYTSQKSLEIDFKKDHDRAGRIVYDIVNYFDNHFTENINIEKLIKTKTNLSLSGFNRQFRSATHTSPLEYINTLRINKAKFLLENTDLNIAEVANMVGYSDPLYFSRFFKKKTGMSPLNYKKSSI